MGKRTNLKKKAVDLLSPNKPLPSPEEAAAQAEAERLQEEEELAEYRRQEAEELERLKKPSPGPQLDVVDEGRKKSSKDRFKEREVCPSLLAPAHAASRPVPLLRGADLASNPPAFQARKQQALLDSLPPEDEAHAAMVIRAKNAEQESLDKTCLELGLVSHEVELLCSFLAIYRC